MPDIVIPIVFPDYKIMVDTGEREIDVPDDLPFLPDKVKIPRYKDKVPQLGHAGVLFIQGANGTTKYYEYGRYDSPEGSVEKRKISNVDVEQGYPTHAKLEKIMGEISRDAGQRGRISAAYIEVPDQYVNMLAYAQRRKQNNATPYNILSNSCNHFMKGVMEAAGVKTPWMVDPRLNSYIEEIRNMYKDLDYDPSTKKMTIEDAPELMAYKGYRYQAA